MAKRGRQLSPTVSETVVPDILAFVGYPVPIRGLTRAEPVKRAAHRAASELEHMGVDHRCGDI